MGSNYAEFLLILVLLYLGTTLGSVLTSHNSEVRCKAEEREALLKFKLQGLLNLTGSLNSWESEEDCCKWEAIECSEQTGHVVKLDLTPEFQCKINSSFLELQHLTYLDLSGNQFVAGDFPEFISSLTQLQYLHLSDTNLHGPIPQNLGNLSSLISLDLSQNQLVELHNLDWLSNLSSLSYLDLSGVNLSQAVNWPGQIDMLPSLVLDSLYLRGCGLSMPHISSAISRANFTSPLSTLDLSSNHLDSFVFPWLSKYTNLLVLDLSFNSLEGVIPELTQFPILRELSLHKNQFNGSLTESIGKLSDLQVLDVTSNYLEGVITEAHFSNLSMLRHVGFSFNSLSLKLSTSWVPPFSLHTIRLSSCKVGPAFPRWLQTQRNFELLDMSSAGISGTIPNWFWDLSPARNFINLSHNEIQGTIPSQWLSNFHGYPTLDMSHNRFSGLLPSVNPWSIIVDLSNNLFQGSMKSFCSDSYSVCMYLNYLDLSHNSLFGEIPEYCFKGEISSQLELLNLANNNFTGRIPDSLGSGPCSLRILQLQNNLFTGELPGQLMHCTNLVMLNLGGNKLSGSIPEWIGMILEDLVVLRLSSNSFNGSIPMNLCHLPRLQILDLSNNNITGTLPRCLDNFTGMTERESSSLMLDNLFYFHSGDVVFHPDSEVTLISVPDPEQMGNLLLMNYIANLFVIFKGKKSRIR